MIELILKGGLSYLLGSIVGSLAVARLTGGVDIRTLGSGNAGATNALRTQGKKVALAVGDARGNYRGICGAGGLERTGLRHGGDARARLPALARLPRRQGRGHPARRGARNQRLAAPAHDPHLARCGDRVRIRGPRLDPGRSRAGSGPGAHAHRHPAPRLRDPVRTPHPLHASFQPGAHACRHRVARRLWLFGTRRGHA